MTDLASQFGTALLLVCITFFPTHSPLADRVMRWWWFRLSYLILVCLCVIVYMRPTEGLLASILFVMASNVPIVRAAANTNNTPPV
jgi:hypothetical protein